MKFCHKCGAQCEDHEKFCKNCGSELVGGTYTAPENHEGEQQYSYQGQQNTYGDPSGQQTPYQTPYQNTYGDPNGQQGGYGSPVVGRIEPRNIVVAVLLSIVTCGIYSIYWMIKLNDEVNELAGEYQATSGGMVFLFSFITCGIYGLYWMYKMGERCDMIKRVEGNSGLLFLIMGIFGFGIVSYCLMQDTINKAV